MDLETASETVTFVTVSHPPSAFSHVVTVHCRLTVLASSVLAHASPVLQADVSCSATISIERESNDSFDSDADQFDTTVSYLS